MSQITITLPDGSRAGRAGTSVLSVARDISPRLADAALAARSMTASSIFRTR